ncbi:uncharacterized protein EV154DRAFT_481023 [Mucor mucedo]|uniref:uncharacterized protein n=1 Tax=Mucor mucedo TaxID=29922 RepID=UPI00221FF1BA|nr:uncharacterized protein EV154DRAFT_481023 [Mucor mucedo]KAI7891591.1 hypothetical protein EV154DRAFT_481023 [Mucor mucedo]
MPKMEFLLFIIASSICRVLVQVELSTKNRQLPILPLDHRQSSSNFRQRVNNYLSSAQTLTSNAKREMIVDNNVRPSTPYSIHDIIFTFSNHLHSWDHLKSVWKEDSVTRRRHINKALHSSALLCRARYVSIIML